MRRVPCPLLLTGIMTVAACNRARREAINAEVESLKGCEALIQHGFRPIAETREKRFKGKVQEFTARCCGGDKAVHFMGTPWVDWSNYYATGDAASLAPEFVKQGGHLGPNGRGIDGALQVISRKLFTRKQS
jgi:hypothetical protein